MKGTRYGRTRSLLVTTSRVVLGARESSGHERNKGQRVRVIPQNELISSLPFFFFLDIYLDSNTPIIRNYHLSIYSSIVFQSGKYSCELFSRETSSEKAAARWPMTQYPATKRKTIVLAGIEAIQLQLHLSARKTKISAL